jgi:excinuclease ABC subunit B
MYADKVTESMKYAIDETERRREYQIEYNEKHNITPKSIEKEIRGRLVEDEEETGEVDLDIEKLDIKQKRILIKQLEEDMLIAADRLEFEKAGKIRDEIKDIKASL